MTAMRKSLSLSLIVALLWASFGFRMDFAPCAGDKAPSFGLLASSGCCCGDAAKTPRKSCQEMSCALPQSVFAQTGQNVSTQQVARKAVDAPAVLVAFTERIRPILLAKVPQRSLPPPVSGRTIGILHQTFLL